MNQIDAVVARLVSKEYLTSLFSESRSYCRKTGPSNCFCTREIGHSGFHVAHFPLQRSLVPNVEPWSDEECK